MKNAPDQTYVLAPQAEGWVVWRGTQCVHTSTTLDDAVGFLPAGVAFQFALPCYPLIMERLRLPAKERAELEGMVQLQWEKSLPFSPEEIIGSFVVLETDDAGADIWTVALPQSALEEFSPPWRKRNRWPVRVVPAVWYVAAACPPDEDVIVLYAEAEHWVLAMVENRRPGWVHVLRGTDAAQFAAELPSLLLTAGMEGVRKTHSRVFVTSETAGCTDGFRAVLEAPIERLPLAIPSANVPIDLLPPSWHAESRQVHGRKRWRQRLSLAAAVYLIIMLAGGAYLFSLQRESSKLEAELRAARPDLVAMEARQHRSDALAQAIDPHRYAIEVLYLLQRCLPADNVQFTEFEQVAQQWRVVGEARSPALAIDYLARLKGDPDLSLNQITADPPRVLANGRAQFQVLGKP